MTAQLSSSKVKQQKWDFWLWMAAPDAPPEAGFRMNTKDRINIWVGEYSSKINRYWAYGNFTNVTGAVTVKVLILATYLLIF